MTFRHPFKSLILHDRSSTGKSVFTCFLVDVFWCIVDKNNKKPVNRAEKNDESRQKREKNELVCAYKQQQKDANKKCRTCLRYEFKMASCTRGKNNREYIHQNMSIKTYISKG